MRSIFVSSTFTDMHFERDAIRDRVLPILNEYFAKSEEEIDFCDLRWGINTSDMDQLESSMRVLEVCLDTINRCRPYMIVLLGERYGWIPGEELMNKAAKREGYLTRNPSQSVTALEIEYGAFSSKEQTARTLFYFRELDNIPDEYAAESELHRQKLRELKDHIKMAAGDHVRTYHAVYDPETKQVRQLDDFVRMVAEDLKELLAEDIRQLEDLSPFEYEVKHQQTYMQHKAVSRGGLRERDITDLMHNDEKVFSSLDFAQLYYHSSGLLFKREDGRFDFTHASLRRGLLRQMKPERRKQLHYRLYKLIGEQRTIYEDLLWKNELIWHALKSEFYYGAWYHIGTTNDPGSQQAYMQNLHDWLVESSDG